MLSLSRNSSSPPDYAPWYTVLKKARETPHVIITLSETPGEMVTDSGLLKLHSHMSLTHCPFSPWWVESFPLCVCVTPIHQPIIICRRRYNRCSEIGVLHVHDSSSARRRGFERIDSFGAWVICATLVFYHLCILVWCCLYPLRWRISVKQQLQQQPRALIDLCCLVLFPVSFSCWASSLWIGFVFFLLHVVPVFI